MINLESKKTIFIILTLITLLAGFLRFYKITSNPVSLNIDEVSIGYNAYSILKTGRDEYGTFMPLSFRSVDDYKAPVLIYLMVPSIAVFGLNEFGVRFPIALIGMLSIIIYYLFFLELTQKNRKISLLAVFLLAISPWHIYFSRYAVEAQLALTLAVLGFWGLFKSLHGKYWWTIFAAFFIALSMYSYHAERLFLPLITLGFLLIYKKRVWEDKKRYLSFIIVCGVLLLPLLISMLFGNDSSRFKATVITNDIEYTRNVLVDKLNPNIPELFKPVVAFFSSDNFVLILYWARKYLNYFHPGYLFYSGLNLTSPGVYGLGIVYLFELPALLLGLYWIFKKKFEKRIFIFLWILLGIFPASLTQNEQHALRSLIIVPMVVLISACGFWYLFELLKRKLNNFSRRVVLSMYSLFIIWNLSLAVLLYSVHFPKHRGEDFMEGTKETVVYALENQDKYQEIVFDPYRGWVSPYIVSIPHMYVLFYSKFDPATYQAIPKTQGDEFYSFGKFTVRKVVWTVDRGETNKLFIASPWSIPEKDVLDKYMLKKVYLSNGKLALVVVSSEK